MKNNLPDWVKLPTESTKANIVTNKVRTAKKYNTFLVGFMCGILLCIFSCIGVLIILPKDTSSSTKSTTSFPTLSKSEAMDIASTHVIETSQSIDLRATSSAAKHAIETKIFLYTLTPEPTITSTSTPIPTSTILLLPTQEVIPYVSPVPEHPAGTSGQCQDGSYTSSTHKKGACSWHGGVAIWWGN